MIFLGSSISSNIEFENKIDIQTSISDRGLPTFNIYGLVNKSIEESKKRITSSFESLGFNFPLKNISINLAPSEIKKDGTHYDLAIAATILKYTNSLSYNPSFDIFFGELSLDGSIRKIKNITYLVILATELGFKRIFLPKENLKEVKYIRGVNLYGVESLKDLLNIDKILKFDSVDFKDNKEELPINFGKIIGNVRNKQILSYCIAGQHHLLLNGFPGTGKSMLAKSSIELAPDLDQEQAYKVAKLFSYSNIERNYYDFYKPPFRAPHSSSSYSAIFGSSGPNISPGEIALSNQGILFLDEFPEFNRLVIEGLRSPLEDKKITLSRAKSKKIFETDFILIASMNPCKCGYFNHKKIDCKCLPAEIKRYQNKISGPILDRIDIYVNNFEFNNILVGDAQDSYSFDKILKLKKRIQDTKNILQNILFDKSTNSKINLLSNIFMQKYFIVNAYSLIQSLQSNYSISNRKLYKLVSVAFTVATFNLKEKIDEESVLEALTLIGN